MEEFEEIQHYVQNLLSPEARKAFEERMKTDEELEQQVRLHRVIYTSHLIHGEGGFKDQFMATAKRIDEEDRRYRREMQRKILAIAAFVILILGAGIVFVKLRTANREEQLAQLQQQVSSALLTPSPQISDSIEAKVGAVRAELTAVRSFDAMTDSVMLSQFTEGKQLFEEQQYSSAIASFQKISQPGFLRQERDFYIAQSFIRTGDYKKAIPLLESLTKTTSPLLQQESIYQLALCYYQLKQPDQARPLLEKTGRESGVPERRKLANDLLESLD